MTANTKQSGKKYWAVQHLGYWLVCPTFGLAELEAKRFNQAKVKQVLITELPLPRTVKKRSATIDTSKKIWGPANKI